MVGQCLLRGLRITSLAILVLLWIGSRAVIADDNDVSLAWDPSISENITSYRVYMGNASRTYGTPVTIGNQTTYTFLDLPNGTYYFAVTAVNADQIESDFSNESMALL